MTMNKVSDNKRTAFINDIMQQAAAAFALYKK